MAEHAEQPVRTAPPAPPRRAAGPVGLEPLLACLVTAFAVLLHVRFFLSAGPLWRDEISSVAIADSPTLRALMANRVNDSIPLLWHVVLRVWERVGLGTTDRGLRVLGVAVGVGAVAALWRNARAFGARSPVVSLVLFELGSMTVAIGDSLRAYGLGVLFGLLSFGAIFELTQAGTDRRRVGRAFVAALVLSLLSVHSLYYNPEWLLAACVAGAAVCGVNGRVARGVAVLAIGAVCAATMAVYIPLFRARGQLSQLFEYPTSLPQVLAALRGALANPLVGEPTHLDLVWGAFAVVAVATAAVTLGRRRWTAGRGTAGAAAAVEGRRRRRDVGVYCLVGLFVGAPAHIGFLVAVHNQPQPFYFLVLFAMAAGCFDGLLAGVVRPGRRLAGLGVGVAAVVVALMAAAPAWRMAGVRMSNVDLVARQLDRSVRPGDVIVISPWYLGSPFTRYYRGAGDLVTVPPVAHLRFQRFDEVPQQMRNPHALDPVLARIAEAARAGHHAWVVRVDWFGFLATVDRQVPSPRPDWHDREYYALWTHDVDVALLRDFDVAHPTVPDVMPAADVNPFERISVFDLSPHRRPATRP